MNRSDLSNYSQTYGRGQHLVTELVQLARYVGTFPNSAAEILAQFDADVAKVRAAIVAEIPVEPEPGEDD